MRFTLPRDLYHGKGSLEALNTFEGKRGMVAQGKQKMKDAVEEGYDKINEYKMTD